VRSPTHDLQDVGIVFNQIVDSQIRSFEFIAEIQKNQKSRQLDVSIHNKRNLRSAGKFTFELVLFSVPQHTFISKWSPMNK
jgi:hypothetical protein